ncbi:MAG: hypothetical protein KGH59_00760 [Candidatus Micrarchaeota archaeon]|nr:hypothetical protein [Candidatus Micrarchaeota archaeon]MDE1846521.1 hypothetical protein [Candidatus Micrarchaeota archaeon]
MNKGLKISSRYLLSSLAGIVLGFFLLIFLGVEALYPNLIAFNLSLFLVGCVQPLLNMAPFLIVVLIIFLLGAVIAYRFIARAPGPFIVFLIFVLSTPILYVTLLSANATFLGATCIASSGYLCRDLYISSTNQLTFTFGEYTGYNLYNASITVAPEDTRSGTVLACKANNAGFPASNFKTISIGTLTNGKNIAINATLPNYVLPSNSIGSVFFGIMWLNYSATQGGIANQSIRVAYIGTWVS